MYCLLLEIDWLFSDQAADGFPSIDAAGAKILEELFQPHQPGAACSFIQKVIG